MRALHLPIGRHTTMRQQYNCFVSVAVMSSVGSGSCLVVAGRLMALSGSQNDCDMRTHASLSVRGKSCEPIRHPTTMYACDCFRRVEHGELARQAGMSAVVKTLISRTERMLHRGKLLARTVVGSAESIKQLFRRSDCERQINSFLLPFVSRGAYRTTKNLLQPASTDASAYAISCELQRTFKLATERRTTEHESERHHSQRECTLERYARTYVRHAQCTRTASAPASMRADDTIARFSHRSHRTRRLSIEHHFY